MVECNPNTPPDSLVGVTTGMVTVARVAVVVLRVHDPRTIPHSTIPSQLWLVRLGALGRPTLLGAAIDTDADGFGYAISIR